MKSRSAAQRDIRKRVIGKDLTHLQIRQARKATETRRGEFEKARTTDSFGSGLAKGPRRKMSQEELHDKTPRAISTAGMTTKEEKALVMRFGIFPDENGEIGERAEVPNDIALQFIKNKEKRQLGLAKQGRHGKSLREEPLG